MLKGQTKWSRRTPHRRLIGHRGARQRLLYGSQLAIIAMMGSMAAAPAAAQSVPAGQAGDADRDDQLQDIIVTAQKRAENLQEVPLAVVALTGDQLAASGIVGTNDLKTAFSGVNIRSTSSYFQPSIRGISTSSINVENPVALYIDGVYYGSQRDAQRDLNDIAQITVLKGPQGTLFGRNATGGVIQIETKAPSHEFGGEVGASIDNYATLRTDAYVTGGLSDAVAFSLSGAYSGQGNGWGRNITTGKDTYKLYHQGAVRGKVLIEPDNDTTITLIGDYLNRRDSFGAYFRPYPGTDAVIPGYIPVKNVYDSSEDFDSRNYFKGGGVSGTIRHDFGGVTATSISAYRTYRAGYTLDADMVPTLNYNVDTRTRGWTVTQELQLSSDGTGPFNWTLGGFYFGSRTAVQPEIDTIGGVFSPVVFQTSVSGAERTESIAPFAQVTYAFVPSTRITLGARWTYEKRRFVGSGLAATVRKPTFRVALDHDFGEHVLGYASFNRGFKSGGYNVANPANPSYSPEELDAYEIGLKTEVLGDRLRLNTSAFYYNYNNLQVVTFQNFQNTIVNGARARLYGVDVDVEAQLAAGLRLNGGLEVLHSEFREFPFAIISTPIPGGLDVTLGDAAGNRLPLAQKFNANVALNYTRAVSFGKLEFNGTMNYNGNYFFESDNVARQRAFTLINLQAGWTSLGGGFSATLFVRNLLNKRIIAQSSALAGIGYLTTYDNPPRVYGASARVRF